MLVQETFVQREHFCFDAKKRPAYNNDHGGEALPE
ncbi:hypothetical protein MAMC_00594 [Methylacidimicrobium cyclopophantes]|uniref:Uncharacterized protein n=1 Tax=Methylacidimicrobium cyclopophantes TaxID=1041766 RepID=A0A5E6MAV4_9BACT|nr:hypothetical protein MAMC_00594 [Methylacidimicrobium cyclopophantes]